MENENPPQGLDAYDLNGRQGLLFRSWRRESATLNSVSLERTDHSLAERAAQEIHITVDLGDEHEYKIVPLKPDVAS